MPNIIFNIPLYFTGITIYIYIYRTRTQSSRQRPLQLSRYWSRDPGSRVQFPAGDLGVAFFATGPGWVLKCISFRHSNLPYFKIHLSVHNECKCQILSLIIIPLYFIVVFLVLIKIFNIRQGCDIKLVECKEMFDTRPSTSSVVADDSFDSLSEVDNKF